ncbi:MAG: Anaerobic ribonucleoside-triphosphate reductase [Parcubacteria group bacterium GW2011_GWA2_36_10]|nr:MAG: Anaerobic ribonucleoside-triphosphate reductase [Parcubacteria group bacterium GW2011_GWA2_36_10]
MLKQIVKRNGQKENFDQHKLVLSLKAALQSAGLEAENKAEKLTDDIIRYLEENFDAEYLSADDVRTAVNIILLDNELASASSAYFKSRSHHQSLNLQASGEVKKIKKRDGTIVDFDKAKVFNAIQKAGLATGEFDAQEAQKLADIVLSVLEHKFDGKIIPKKSEIRVRQRSDLPRSQRLGNQKYFLKQTSQTHLESISEL